MLNNTITNKGRYIGYTNKNIQCVLLPTDDVYEPLRAPAWEDGNQSETILRKDKRFEDLYQILNNFGVGKFGEVYYDIVSH